MDSFYLFIFSFPCLLIAPTEIPPVLELYIYRISNLFLISFIKRNLVSNFFHQKKSYSEPDVKEQVLGGSRGRRRREAQGLACLAPLLTQGDPPEKFPKKG